MDISILEQIPVMVIIRHHSPFDVKGLFTSILESGFPCAEITLNTPGALQHIEKAVNHLGRDMCIGTGTVLSVADVEKSLDAGAQFIVSPIFNPEVVALCTEREVPVFPGAVTPTEIYNCHQAGARMVKIFPATMVGPQNFKALKAPFEDIKLLAVGGVNETNVQEYLTNGTDAVAIGSGTIKPQWIENCEYSEIKKSLNNLYEAI